MRHFQDKMSWDWPGWFVFLFLTNLIVKVVPLFQDIMIHPDAPVYLWAAQFLEKGSISEAIKAYPMLFYPFLVMCVHKLGLDWLAAGRVVSVAASTVALFPFFGLARKFFPGWSALIITSVFIMLPEYNSISFAAIRDPLYLCFSLWAVYFAVCYAEQNELKWLAGLVFFTICLPLLRVEGVIAFLVIIGWIFARFMSRLDSAGRLWALGATLCLLIILVSIFSFSETGFDLIRLKEIIAYARNFDTTPRSLTFYLTKLDELAHNDFPVTFGNNFWLVAERNWPLIYGIGMVRMLEVNLSWLLILLGLIGLRDMLRIRQVGWLLLIALFIGNILLILAKYLYSGCIETRYMLFPSILWLLFAGVGFSSIAFYFSEKFSGKIFGKKLNVVALLSLLLIVPFAYETAFMKYNINIRVIPESCRWMNEQILNDGKEWKVWVNFKTLAWFLDRKDVTEIRIKNKENVLEILHQNNTSVAVLVLLSRRTKSDLLLMDDLLSQRNFSSKVFTDARDKKNIVVAIWRENVH